MVWLLMKKKDAKSQVPPALTQREPPFSMMSAGILFHLDHGWHCPKEPWNMLESIAPLLVWEPDLVTCFHKEMSLPLWGYKFSTFTLSHLFSLFLTFSHSLLLFVCSHCRTPATLLWAAPKEAALQRTHSSSWWPVKERSLQLNICEGENPSHIQGSSPGRSSPSFQAWENCRLTNSQIVASETLSQNCPAKVHLDSHPRNCEIVKLRCLKPLKFVIQQ